jgi:hypothetical protein
MTVMDEINDALRVQREMMLELVTAHHDTNIILRDLVGTFRVIDQHLVLLDQRLERMEERLRMIEEFVGLDKSRH